MAADTPETPWRQVPAQVDFPALEREMLTLWDEHDTFAKSLEQSAGGQPWTFGSGETDAFLSTADSFFVNLYPGAVTPCSFGAPTDVNLVTMQVPSTPGSYPISLQRNVTLYVASTSFNNVATRGLMVIDSVTATTVSGGLNTTYDDANHVDGQFQATICP